MIALTASVIRSDLDKCRAAGMDDYVPKPFSTSQLLQTIAKLTTRELRFMNKNEPEKIIPKTSGVLRTDLNYLQNFCEGNLSKMQKYINIFLDSVPVFVLEMETALGENNFKEIAAQAHGFKTKFVMMGMEEAKELASQIEMDCRLQKPDKATVLKNTRKLLDLIADASEELTNR